MPSHCSVCRERIPPYLSVFRYPTDPERRLEWIHSLQVNTPTKTAVVCEKHFSTDQFSNKQRKRLTLDAVPTREARVPDPEEIILTSTRGKLKYKSKFKKPAITPAAFRSQQRELRLCKEKLSKLNWSFENVLNWIRDGNDNHLPEEVVGLIDPEVLNEIKLEGNSFGNTSEEETEDFLEQIMIDVKPEVVHSEASDNGDADWEPKDEEDNMDIGWEPKKKKSTKRRSVAVSSVVSEVKVEPQDEDDQGEGSGTHTCLYCDAEFCSMKELSKHSLTHCEINLPRLPLPEKYTLRRRAATKARRKISKTIKDNFLPPKPVKRQKPKPVKSKKLEPVNPKKPESVNHKKPEPEPEKNHEHKYYYCHVCNTKFRHKKFMVCHIAKEHPGEAPFKCEICGRGLMSERSMQYHMQASHPTEEQSHLCPTCGKTFRMLRTLQKHVASVHAESRNHQCEYCDYAATTSSLLAQHKYRHFRKNMKQCPHCGMQKHSAALNHHIEAVHEGKRLKCNFCAAVIHSKNILRQHFLYKHPDLPSSISPVECTTLIYVEPRHGLKRKYFPDPDDAGTGQPDGNNEVHPPEGAGAGTWEASAQQHLQPSASNPILANPVKPRRSRSKKFPIKECEVCNKWIDLDLLPEHMSRLHSHPFKCNFCQIEYYTFKELNEHFLTVHFAGTAMNAPVDGAAIDDVLRQRYGNLIPHDTDQLICILCNNHPFNKRSELAAHLERHRRNPDYRMVPRYILPVVMDPATEVAPAEAIVEAPTETEAVVDVEDPTEAMIDVQTEDTVDESQNPNQETLFHSIDGGMTYIPIYSSQTTDYR